MLFNTLSFFAFFALVFALFHLLRGRLRTGLLFVASYVFYGAWDWRFLSLLAVSTVVDFTVARWMTGAEERRRRLLLLVSLCVNLGLLGFFKYHNFFVDSAAELMSAVGLRADMPTLKVILPVGISFYTFQTLAYTIDVYRGRMQATDDLLAFAVYVAYFPQLVAGPIERAQRLLPQIIRPAVVDARALGSGALLFAIGLVRKVVVADMAAPVVDAIFADPAGHTSLEVARGVFLFGIQIYGDFAGYSDMARGASRMLGIELVENFQHPYFARNITDFWRRWHVSLSQWLRDYLYIPLGGNRGGSLRTYRNLFLTMLLGGLWHGAAWTFVAWGGLHGVALAVHKLVVGRGITRSADLAAGGRNPLLRGVSWLVTMLFVWFAWVFFRATGFGNAVEVLEALVALRGPWDLWLLYPVAGACLLLVLIDMPQFRIRDHCAPLRWPAPVRGALYALFVIALLVFWSSEQTPFIYFQF